MLLKDAVQLRSEDPSRLRSLTNSFYAFAYTTAREHGVPFARWALKDVDDDTMLTICCNGAEHLGTIIESYAKTQGLRIAIHYNYLNRKVCAPWKVMVGKVDGVRKYKVGYLGALPDKFEYRDDDAQQAGNSEQELGDYLETDNVFSRSRLKVVDSGFDASIPEVVASLARRVGYKGTVAGLMFNYAIESALEHTIPVDGYNLHLPPDKRRDTRAAFLLEQGGSGWLGELGLEQQVAFRKSRASPTKLVRENGRFVPDTPLFEDEFFRAQYKATLLGIEDGIRAALNGGRTLQYLG
jgi:hypothetical protein